MSGIPIIYTFPWTTASGRFNLEIDETARYSVPVDLRVVEWEKAACKRQIENDPRQSFDPRPLKMRETRFTKGVANGSPEYSPDDSRVSTSIAYVAFVCLDTTKSRG